MIEFITENREWLFGGLGTSIFIWWLNSRFSPFKKTQTEVEASSENLSAGIVINNNNNVNNNINTENNSKSSKKVCKHTSEERKLLTKILFIDDETFKVVSILKKSGWVNTKIKKKVTGPDDRDIVDADICFVDIYGVATELYKNDQGLGLVGAIKDRHPKKKVVVYSSQEKGDVFNELWSKADARLSKNAEPYQFENLLENLSESIYC